MSIMNLMFIIQNLFKLYYLPHVCLIADFSQNDKG